MELSQIKHARTVFTVRVPLWGGNMYVPVGRPLVFVCDEDIQDIVAIAASFILSFQNNPRRQNLICHSLII